MADIFGAQKNVHGADEVVQSSGVLVSIGETVALAQNLNLQYQRTVQALFELGSEDVYVAVTPGQGTCEVSRFITESSNVYTYVKDDNCQDYTVDVQAGKGTCTAKVQSIHASGCHTMSVGEQVQAGQSQLTETMQIFVGMVEKG